MALRWIAFSRVSMQRAGVLVAVAAGAGPRPTDLPGIARAYAPLLQRRVVVPPERAADVAAHLRELRLWKRYRELREADHLPKGARVQVQDLWLADPSLPSATGAITDDVLHEPPQLAASLRLVREQNYTATDRGKALLAVSQVPVADANEDDGAPNPFKLTLGSRAILLYALLDADFDFMQSTYAHAAPRDGSAFRRSEFASKLNIACRDLKSRWVRRARTGTERKLLMRLDELAKEIDKPRASGKNWGGGRPPDQTATVRLEPYVDIGLVTKLSRTSYRYRITPGQGRFFKALLEAEEAEHFLDGGLFCAFVESLGSEAKLASEEVMWQTIVDAYQELRSRLGFAAFKEVALLGIARLLEQGDGSYCEVSHAIELLKAKRSQDPRSLRFGVARGGALTYMKLTDERALR